MRVYDRKTRQFSQPDWGQLDRPFAAIATPLRQVAGSWDLASEHVIPEYTPISDQGVAGSCVANSWCDMYEVLIGLETPNSVPQLSRRFAYWIARYLTGDTGKDDGTYLRSMAQQFKNI